MSSSDSTQPESQSAVELFLAQVGLPAVQAGVVGARLIELGYDDPSDYLNLEPEEFVALMGANTLGFVGTEKKGPHTRWCLNPYVFDNTHFQELLLKDQSKYYKDESDLKLL